MNLTIPCVLRGVQQINTIGNDNLKDYILESDLKPKPEPQPGAGAAARSRSHSQEPEPTKRTGSTTLIHSNGIEFE